VSITGSVGAAPIAGVYVAIAGAAWKASEIFVLTTAGSGSITIASNAPSIGNVAVGGTMGGGTGNTVSMVRTRGAVGFWNAPTEDVSPSMTTGSKRMSPREAKSAVN
jgi:hypothetical protein